MLLLRLAGMARVRMTSEAVAKTYLWQNGMAMVFGEDGEQIPELQGRATAELAEAIRKRSTPATEWIGWGEDGPAVWPTEAVEKAWYGSRRGGQEAQEP